MVLATLMKDVFVIHIFHMSYTYIIAKEEIKRHVVDVGVMENSCFGP